MEAHFLQEPFTELSSTEVLCPYSQQHSLDTSAYPHSTAASTFPSCICTHPLLRGVLSPSFAPIFCLLAGASSLSGLNLRKDSWSSAPHLYSQSILGFLPAPLTCTEQTSLLMHIFLLDHSTGSSKAETVSFISAPSTVFNAPWLFNKHLLNEWTGQ